MINGTGLIHTDKLILEIVKKKQQIKKNVMQNGKMF